MAAASTVSASKPSYTSPKTEWVSLAHLRFSFAPVSLETNESWLGFWEKEAKLAAGGAGLAGANIRRPTRQDRWLTVQVGQERLILDGAFGRALLWPSGAGRTQWPTAD